MQGEMQIRNRSNLVSHGNRTGRAAVLDILEAGMKALDPYTNTRKIITLHGNSLTVGLPEYSTPPGLQPLKFDLRDIDHIYVVGGGKAVQKMAKAVEDELGDLITDSQINVKKGESLLCQKINVTFAGHPLPDEESLSGAQRILEIERKARERDLVFVITSGGGTALKALPAPGITLEDLRETYELLYFGAGVSMPEANAVRNLMTVVRNKHAKNIKGATVIEIVTPEQIPGLRIHTYSTPQGSNAYDQAIEILKKYDCWDKVSPRVRSFFEQKDPAFLPPTPEEWAQRPYYRFRVMGPEYMFDAICKKAEELGLNAMVLASSLNDVEARAAGQFLGSIAEEEAVNGRPCPLPCVLVLGGETPVATGGEKGLGGRNQELVLSAAPRIAGCDNVVIASADSDGTDGPTPYAGGIVDGFTMERITAAGIDLDKELQHHNSTPVLQQLDDLIITGNTGTNCRDIRLIYVGKKL
jgi:glycerate 2-kinase